ncbi:MAG TPA: L-lactate permease [Peptococcaceae bacterium]|nr:L-lactate permease [Peptococcaceae bacterium]
MSILMQGFLALLPILVVAIFLVGMRWPASKAMPLSYITAVIVAYFVWKLPVIRIVGATVNGIVTAVSLLYIIYGSVLVLYTIMESGGLHQIRQSLIGVSPDRRVQVIIVAWLFGSFIEGSSGFGTPAAVACPLMLGLGFPAFASVIAGMIIQSTPVSFGAVGTPMRVGAGTGLAAGKDQLVNEFAAQIGIPIIDSAGNFDSIAYYDHFIAVFAHKVAILHFVGGLLTPLLLCGFMTRIFGKNKSWSEGFAIWPFALFGALAFTIPYVLINHFISYELTSMLGALTGLVIVVFAAKNKFLTPKEEDTWDFLDKKDWDPSWTGNLEVHYVEKPGGMSALMAWMPYIYVAGLILFTRLVEPVKVFLNSIVISLPPIGGVGSSWGIAYSPGTIFIIVSLLTFFTHGMKPEAYAKAWKQATKVIVSASVALIFTVPMVQVLINSDGGAAGYMKMPYALAEATYQLTGGLWPLFAPIIGGLGAFVAGSNTVSNMTFALFQFKTAQLIVEGNPALASKALDWPIWIVALQAIGGAAGNTICIHNVVAASAVVGFVGREGDTIRKTFLFFLYYAFIPGAVGYSYLYWDAHGPFNLGTIILIVFYAAVIYMLATNNKRLQKLKGSISAK